MTCSCLNCEILEAASKLRSVVKRRRRRGRGLNAGQEPSESDTKMLRVLVLRISCNTSATLDMMQRIIDAIRKREWNNSCYETMEEITERFRRSLWQVKARQESLDMKAFNNSLCTAVAARQVITLLHDVHTTIKNVLEYCTRSFAFVQCHAFTSLQCDRLCEEHFEAANCEREDEDEDEDEPPTLALETPD